MSERAESGKVAGNGNGQSKPNDRKVRSAEALRANLKRRKEQRDARKKPENREKLP